MMKQMQKGKIVGIVSLVAVLGVVLGVVIYQSQASSKQDDTWTGLYVPEGSDGTLARKWSQVQRQSGFQTLAECQQWALGVRKSKVKLKTEIEDAFLCVRHCGASWLDALQGKGDELICADTHAGSFQRPGENHDDQQWNNPLNDIR